MEEGFLKERLNRFLKIILTEYKVVDNIKRAPKAFTITLERIPGSKGTYTVKVNPKHLIVEKEALKKKGHSQKESKKKDLMSYLVEG